MRQTHDGGLPGSTHELTKLSDREICDAYLYLLGRLLVLRQEHLDFSSDGFEWNELVYRPVGTTWANPNLDVVYSEAWVALDETSATVIELPEIVGRYYTVQVINPWGETIANINERNYPAHPSGSFALCMKGAPSMLSAGTQRIDVPSRKCRLLARIELGEHPKHAVELMQRVKLRATGKPEIAAPVPIPVFSNDKLPGVEAFDAALAILAAERDINPGTDAVQRIVRSVAASIRDPSERGRIDRVIRRQAWRQLAHAVAGMGIVSQGWVQPKLAGNFGDDWLSRTVANLTGMWSNTKDEVLYFGAGSTSPLVGSDVYTMTFRSKDLPSSHVRYFWSVTCVDAVTYHVVPNAENRFQLGHQSPLTFASDGSLTLYFAPQKPPSAPDSNWLPTPTGQRFLLTWRSYGADRAALFGVWFPPKLEKK